MMTKIPPVMIIEMVNGLRHGQTLPPEAIGIYKR